MTTEQDCVVKARLKDGYEIVGKSTSETVTSDVILLQKGKHTLAINTLGYDEHYFGKTWNLKGNHE